MARTVRAALAAALFTFVALATAPVASADSASGVAYLASTQDEYGGWDGDPTSGSEFTTSEAILAIAEAAQTGTSWSTTEAFDAVDQFADDVSGDTPLDYMDAAANNQVITPGKAAKWIVNVVEPLGLDASSFFGVDLVVALGSPGADGSFGTGANFNGAGYAALASYLLDGSVPPQTVTYLLDAQTAGGGWSFDGDPSHEPDTDSTALTIEALVAAGLTDLPTPLADALRYLASVDDGTFGAQGYDNATGGWLAFDAPSPEATSRAMIGLVALGFDTATPCWRDTAAPELSGTPYIPPTDALLGLQQGDGSWTGFVASFTTAQAIQGLEVGTWRPVAAATAPTCEVPPPPAPVLVEPTFTG